MLRFLRWLNFCQCLLKLNEAGLQLLDSPCEGGRQWASSSKALQDMTVQIFGKVMDVTA